MSQDRERRKARNVNYRETTRSARLKTAYGITTEDYAAMLAEQNGVCGICAQPETRKTSVGIAPLSVDHDHATGAVRSLLCHACNSGLGHFKDQSDRMRAAADYIDSWR